MTTAYESGAVPSIEVRHRLRIAREFAGLEQDELANLMGIARNTVINAEKGHRQPRRIVVNAWALACGVPASWILTGEGPPVSPLDGISSTEDAQAGLLLPRLDSSQEPADVLPQIDKTAA